MRLIERNPERVMPLDEVRGSIEKMLRAGGERRMLADLVEKLRAKATIVRYWPAPSPPPRALPRSAAGRRRARLARAIPS